MISLTNTLITILVAIVDCGFMLDKGLSTAVNSLNISHNGWIIKKIFEWVRCNQEPQEKSRNWSILESYCYPHFWLCSIEGNLMVWLFRDECLVADSGRWRTGEGEDPLCAHLAGLSAIRGKTQSILVLEDMSI